MPASEPCSNQHGSRTSGPGPEPEIVERALAADRDQAVRRLARLTGSVEELIAAAANSNADDEHDPEGATIAYERSQLDALVHRSRLNLEEIDAAVARIAQGRYGVCETCGRPIAADRLEVRPIARECIACASGRSSIGRPSAGTRRARRSTGPAAIRLVRSDT